VEEDDKSKGFCLGYEVYATKDNQLTVKDEVAPSIKDFYDDSKSWPSDRPMQVETVVRRSDGDVKVRGSTDALGGLAEPRIYKNVVNIG
jgi:hypothetical protein